jgi:hypothetical protein
MLPEAKNEALLYVSTYSDVLVFSYPEGKQVGDLKGFTSAAGECVDSKGNVFITSFRPWGANEYAHGGTKRIGHFQAATIPLACAINPKSGDLAICGSSGDVEIYKRAQGKPIVLHDDRMVFGSVDAYDDEGNLFFLGLRFGDKQRLSELLSGSSTFINIKADASIDGEGGLQWNNGLLTAVSYTRHVSIYQFQVLGTKAHKVGATPLGAPAYTVLQYFIDKNTLIVPNLRRSATEVLYYKYPEGGSPTFTLAASMGPRAAVVSAAAL